jgi:hypothetical protein
MQPVHHAIALAKAGRFSRAERDGFQIVLRRSRVAPSDALASDAIGGVTSMGEENLMGHKRL